MPRTIWSAATQHITYGFTNTTRAPQERRRRARSVRWESCTCRSRRPLRNRSSRRRSTRSSREAPSIQPLTTSVLSNFTPVALWRKELHIDRPAQRSILPELRHPFSRRPHRSAPRRIPQGTIQKFERRLVQDSERDRRQPAELRTPRALPQPDDEHQAGRQAHRRELPNQLGYQERAINATARPGVLQQPVLRNFLRLPRTGSAFGLQANRRFGVSITLAGLGSFSNPMGSAGDNSSIR